MVIKYASADEIKSALSEVEQKCLPDTHILLKAIVEAFITMAWGADDAAPLPLDYSSDFESEVM